MGIVRLAEHAFGEADAGVAGARATVDGEGVEAAQGDAVVVVAAAQGDMV